MLIAKAHYAEPAASQQLIEGFKVACDSINKEPLFLCIGSDRHILDCFAPLVGTMLVEKVPGITLYGTLDHPLHARNLVKELRAIKENHPHQLEIAIDASLGSAADIGYIKFRDESLQPGKALAKNLPAIGDLSLIGIVGARIDRYTVTSLNSGSLAHVYHMAAVLADAIAKWLIQRENTF